MMADQFRKVEQYSPKSSPRGARSPVVSRQDSTGTLKTTISLGKNPSIVHSGPFYLMKEPPGIMLKQEMDKPVICAICLVCTNCIHARCAIESFQSNDPSLLHSCPLCLSCDSGVLCAQALHCWIELEWEQERRIDIDKHIRIAPQSNDLANQRKGKKLRGKWQIRWDELCEALVPMSVNLVTCNEGFVTYVLSNS